MEALLQAGFQYVTARAAAVRGLESELFSVGVVSMDVVECGVLLAALHASFSRAQSGESA